MLRVLFLLTTAVLATDGWMKFFPPIPNQGPAERLHLDLKKFESIAVDGAVIHLPFKYNQYVRVRLSQYNVSDFAKTFMFKGVDKYIHGTLTSSTRSVQISLRTQKDHVSIGPLRGVSSEFENVYEIRERESAGGNSVCRTKDDENLFARDVVIPSGPLTSGSDVRVLQLALSATAQFGAYQSSFTPGSSQYFEEIMLFFTASINEANEYFVETLALYFQLFPGSWNLISANPNDFISVDNYNDPSLTMERNGGWIVNINGVDPDDFDIGHVFFLPPAGTESDGASVVGSVCAASATTRCKGATGARPEKTTFVETFVHQLAHQLGARHTFNSNRAACVGDRDPASAIEPDVGVSFMSFAERCGSPSLVLERIFTWLSIVQMAEGITVCPFNFENPGEINIISVTANFTIPRETPFILNINATTTSVFDRLRYSFGEADVGPASSS